MGEVRVRAVGVDARRSQPMVLLEETGSAGRVVPVWIGLPEVNALEQARQQVVASRPGTHALIGELITRCGRRLQRVCITALRSGVFFAELVLDDQTRVSARPSDGLVLAVQQQAPIEVADAVLEQAGLRPGAVIEGIEQASADPTNTGTEAATQDQIEQFRRFLDTATPDDFDPNDPQ